MKKICIVEGCELDQRAKGLCIKHYKRLWSGGDPHTPSPQELSLEERFRAKLGPRDPVTGCIEWVGARVKGSGRAKGDYGHIWEDGKHIKAHRLAWELKHGPIPEGVEVCHTCDNPPCCNDEHLFLGTKSDNMADMLAKGRGNKAKGEAHGRAKLAEADVLEIRRRLAAGDLQRVIAKDFGIGINAVSNIKIGKNWK